MVVFPRTLQSQEILAAKHNTVVETDQPVGVTTTVSVLKKSSEHSPLEHAHLKNSEVVETNNFWYTKLWCIFVLHIGKMFAWLAGKNGSKSEEARNEMAPAARRLRSVPQTITRSNDVDENKENFSFPTVRSTPSRMPVSMISIRRHPQYNARSSLNVTPAPIVNRPVPEVVAETGRRTSPIADVKRKRHEDPTNDGGVCESQKEFHKMERHIMRQLKSIKKGIPKDAKLEYPSMKCVSGRKMRDRKVVQENVRVFLVPITPDLKLLQTIGLEVIHVWESNEIADDRKYEHALIAQKFGRIVKKFAILWRRKMLPDLHEQQVNEIFEKMQRSVLANVQRKYSVCELKRIVSLLFIWYRRQTDSLDKGATLTNNELWHMGFFAYLAGGTGCKLFCEYCAQVFLETPAYEQHRRYHIGRMEYKCNDCQMGFLSLDDELTHKTNMHSFSDCSDDSDSTDTDKTESSDDNDMEWVCKTCNLILASQDELDKHCKTHLRSSMWRCARCSIAFPSKEEARAHVRVQHRRKTEKQEH